MTDTCRAAVFNGDGTYDIRTFDKPVPPQGGAVIKVEAVGMCSSDVSQLNGHKHVPGEVAPVVAGHEIVGRVDQLADDADLGVSIGDRIAVDLINRNFAYKDRLVIYGYTLGVDDESGLWGGYGEYMSIMPGTSLIKLTESLPAEHLTIYEPLANAVNWVDMAGVKKGDTVVVLGPGHVGLMCVVAAKNAGASNIIVTGTSKDEIRLKTALATGAQHIINVDKEDAVKRVKEITRGRKANVVMEVTAMSTKAVAQALDMVMFSGTVILAGLKNNMPVEIITDNIVLNSITVKGGAGSSEESMKTAVDLLNQGKVPTKELLGEVFTLDDFDEALLLLKREHPERETFRVTIKHDKA
jgi:threonine dehydrogenase-like Zn-dependent dehydrogenase